MEEWALQAQADAKSGRGSGLVVKRRGCPTLANWVHLSLMLIILHVYETGGFLKICSLSQTKFSSETGGRSPLPNQFDA